jgi:hypothetical protein
MKLVHAIHTETNGRLELLVGDLTEMPTEHAVDALVVSAFPGDYAPTPTSLIGALATKGLSVARLARDKEWDLRGNFNCWVSRELSPQPGLPYQRLMCFEPTTELPPVDRVGDIFRALEPFSHAPPFIQSVAIPLVTTGDRGGDADFIAAALVNAAWHRLQEGHPIRTVKIVVRNEAVGERVARYFEDSHTAFGVDATFRSGIPPTGVTRSERLLRNAAASEMAVLHSNISALSISSKRSHSAEGYDAFVSYSRRDQDAARIVAEALRATGARIFIDELEIDLGVAWQQTIFDALEKCRCVVALYSPDFLKSKVCQDEFAAAMILRRRRDDPAFISPLLVQDVTLPAYMEMLNYADCRVADAHRLKANARRIADRLGFGDEASASGI